MEASDIAVSVCVGVGGYVCYHDKMKTLYQNNLKHGTVIVLDGVSRPIGFGLKRSRVRV